jgi:hypothetical protein
MEKAAKKRSKQMRNPEAVRERAGIQFNRDLEAAQREFNGRTATLFGSFYRAVDKAKEMYSWGGGCDEDDFVRATAEAADRIRFLVDEAAQDFKAAARVAVEDFDRAAEAAERGEDEPRIEDDDAVVDFNQGAVKVAAQLGIELPPAASADDDELARLMRGLLLPENREVFKRVESKLAHLLVAALWKE